MNFAEQGPKLIQHLATRNRRPAKPATVATYERYLRCHITPMIGQMELKDFGNGALKEFGRALVEKKLSPKSVNEIAAFVRAIVAFPVTADGDRLFPRDWNFDFVDLPVVQNQKQSTVTPSQLQAVLATKYGVFFALLAGTGLRIGEILPTRIGDDGEHTCWDSEASAIHVRTSIWRRKEQPPKTVAAIRTVDLDPRLNDLLKAFAGERTGYLFQSKVRKMMHESTLAKVLREFEIKGFHCFRRLKTTRCREMGCPEDILRGWLGHADVNQTDAYSKLSENAAARSDWAARVGLGFDLPTISAELPATQTPPKWSPSARLSPRQPSLIQTLLAKAAVSMVGQSS
jgi:integrase